MTRKHMQQLKTACREAAWVFGMSRLVFVLVSFVSIFLLPRFIIPYRERLAWDEPYTVDPNGLKAFFFSWFRWDVKAYVNISMNDISILQILLSFPSGLSSNIARDCYLATSGQARITWQVS